MYVISKGREWVVEKIMSYMKKYFTSFSYENIQVAMLEGSCSFDELDLNVNVLEQEFKLPCKIIRGHVQNLKIELPWYKFLSNVEIKIESIEFDIKMKATEKYQNDEKKNDNEQNDLEPDIEVSISFKELCIKKIVNAIYENLSISCSNVIFRLIEDDIVIRVDIKFLELNPSNDDWRPNNMEKRSTTQWILKRMGKVNGITISMNKCNNSGNIEYYFDPLVLNMSLSIRFCCIFATNCSVQPYFIQLDIFSPKLIFTLMEPHVSMITELLNLFKNYKSVNTLDEQRNMSTSSASKLIQSEESWRDLIKNWIFATNNQKCEIGQVLKIGIYVQELKCLLNFDVNKLLNEYKPSTSITCHGLKLIYIQSSIVALNIQFGISRITMKPEEKCPCCFKDCSNNKKSYFSSGQIQEDYLHQSLFYKHTSLNDENEFFVIYNAYEEKTSLKTFPSLAFIYIIHQKLTNRYEISLEAGACVINLTLGLINRFQFIHKLLLEQYSTFLNTKLNSEIKCTNSLGNSQRQNFCVDIKISNIKIKILSICHVPLNYEKKQYDLITDNFPEALIEIHNLRGVILTNKSITRNNTEEKKEKKIILVVNKLEAKIFKLNTMHSLLKVDKIEWNKLETHFIENKSDSLLSIGTVKFESSKDKYLLFYYIVHAMVTYSQCNKMYTDNCFINPELLQSNLNLAILFWEIEDINIHCISQNQSTNVDVTLKNMSAETFKLDEKKQIWSKVMKLSSNEPEYIIHPFLHIMVQILSTDDVTQTTLLFVKTADIAINIDPLFFEWLVYVPEYRKNPTERIDNRIGNDLSFNFPVEDQLDNESKRFYLFEKLKSTLVFVEFSTVTLYFPSDVISIAQISFIDKQIDVKRWHEILIDYDIDVLVMSASRFTIKCAVEMEQVESYFDGFPNLSSESIWFNDQSLFPWKINLKQLKCCIFNKKCVQSKIQDEIRVFDTIDILCSLVMTETTKIHNDQESKNFESSLDCRILNLINIYISDQQVKIVSTFLKNITDVLRVFAHTTECHIKTDDFITNTEDEISKNHKIEKSTSNVKTSETFINKNDMPNRYLVNISVDLNDICIIFSKNNGVNQAEPSLNICLYHPNITFSSKENSKCYQIIIYHAIMYTYTTTYQKVIKPAELPKIKDSIVFFETNNPVGSEEDMNFITINLYKPHKKYHPEIQIKIKRNMYFSIYKVTINTLLKVINMFNQKLKTENNSIIKNDSTDDYLKSSDSNVKLTEHIEFESFESNVGDIFNQDMLSNTNWTACIESKRISIKLFTETKDKLILNVECTYWELTNVRNVHIKRIQTNGKISIYNTTISLEHIDSNDLFLHPINISINVRLTPLNSGKLQKNCVQLNIYGATLDLSQNRFKTLLVIWKTYSYLFKTKNNITLINDDPKVVIALQLSILKAKINFLQDVKNISLARYHCVSEDLVKRKLLTIHLDTIEISLHFYKEEINASVRSNIDCKLLLYEHLTTKISIVTFLIDLTITHAINHKIQSNNVSIQTDYIRCKMGPHIATSLIAAMDLWFNPFTDAVPYIICNDTCFTITFRQKFTNENIILNSLEYYNYSWLISTENPCLQFAIKNEDQMSDWSEKIAINGQNQKYLTIKDSNGKDTILIITMQQTSPICVKIVITSSLKLMNKTEYSLNARIITDKRDNYNQQDPEHILIVGPYEVTPSLMFDLDSTFSVALRFSTLDSHWSNVVHVNNVHKTKENTKSVHIKIPKKVNLVTEFNDVVCHFVFEVIDDIAQLLILLLPPFVICSYLPNSAMLNVSIVKSNRKTSNNVIKIKSAIEQKIIQKIDLPIQTLDSDNEADILLSLKEDEHMLSLVSALGHVQLENESYQNNKLHGIEEHINNPYALEKTNLKWPFVGSRFDHVPWTSGIAQHKIRTIQRIQNYGFFGGLGIFTRLITIQPRALVVNTTGQSISLHSLTSVRCTLTNMSVAVPADNEDRTFHIKMNVDDDYRHRSSAIKFFDEESSPNLDEHGNSAPTDGQSIIFANSPHSVAYLIATTSVFNGTKIMHLQSLYVATNCSSADLQVLLMCSMPTANLLDVPAYSEELFVDLPRTSVSLGKPLALWNFMGSATIHTAELSQYLIIAWKGRLSCPVGLRNIKLSEKDEHPVPVVFSSFGPDVCAELPSISMTLKKADGQYVIAISEQPYPQLVFYNHSPSPLIVTDRPEFTKEPIIRLIVSDWYWPYEIMPGETSYLSFPYTTLVNGKVTLYLVVVDRKSCTVAEWFASITMDNNECTSLLGPESDQEIQIKISRRAFTWDVVFYTKNDQNITPIRTLPVNNEAVESRFFVDNCIGGIVCTLLMNEFPLKKLLTVVLSNIKTNIRLVENNINQDDDIKLVFSINDIGVYNDIFYDDNFEFPVIIYKKSHGIAAVHKNENIKCLSQQIHQLNKIDSDNITITFIINKSSSYSTPVILDLEVSLSVMEVFIEDKYVYYLLKYFKTYNVKPLSYEVQNEILDGFIPINTLPLPAVIRFRTLRITPFQIFFNLQWCKLFYISMNHLQIKFPEFKKRNIQTSLPQLGQCVSIHYYDSVINNADNAMSSLGLFGTPRNFICMAKKGYHDFVSMSSEGYVRGPIEFAFGLGKGLRSLAKHVSLGMFLSVSNLVKSWSRTFNNFKLLKNIGTKIVNVFKMVVNASKFFYR